MLLIILREPSDTSSCASIGRKGRLVRVKNGTGVKWEARNASGVAAGATLEMINVHERGAVSGGQEARGRHF